jgi:hypothetical protein
MPVLGNSCGDPTGNGLTFGGLPRPAVITAADALFVLNSAVGAASCQNCFCDVNNSGGVTATDALFVLNAAVGLEVTLVCPPC